MANWLNIRLVAVGPDSEIARLRELAKPALTLARKKPVWREDEAERDDAADAIFTSGMIHGEGADLSEEPLVRLVGRRAKANYWFQLANDDGVEHFKQVSLRFSALRFLVVWCDPNTDSVGSAYIRMGRAASYEMGTRRKAAMHTRARVQNGGLVDDENDFWVWEAYSEMMDAAERRWARYLGSLRPIARKRR